MSEIKKIRTIRLKKMPNLFWIELETKDGLTGLGEAFRGTQAIEGAIFGEIGPWLLGKDSRHIEMISRTLMTPYVGYHSASAEVRAASAVDIALWDLFGKRNDIPVYEALGGAARTSVPVYNTCAGYAFNTGSSAYDAGSSRRNIKDGEGMRGPYDDQIAFTRDAGALAESLVAEGYQAMKIWPFDPFAAKCQGATISLEDLKKGLEPFKKIRDAVGNKIEVMCELHSLWSVPAALRICKALEEYDIFWAEDPICKMDDVASLQYLRSKTSVPICGSETLAGAVTFRHMFEKGTFDYAMADLSWCGGLTEGRKIAALAESYAIPLSPHDCTGPIVLWAGLHLTFHASSALFQEVVRANMATWYKDLVTDLPIIENGKFKMPEKPGIGANLLPEVKEREDAIIREIG